AHRGLRDEERRLFIRRGPGDRRPLPAPGPRAGPEEARGHARTDPADHARPGAARTHLRAGPLVGHRAAGGGGVRRLHQGLRLLRPLTVKLIVADVEAGVAEPTVDMVVQEPVTGISARSVD